MARKKERFTIGGSQFIITQLGAVEGRGLYKKFVGTIGPLLREMLSGPLLKQMQGVMDDSSSADTEEKSQATALTAMSLLAPMLIRAFEDMPQPFFEELCEAFTRCSDVVIGSPPMPIPLSTPSIFDNHFAGDYPSMTAWLIQCIKFNGFLGRPGSLDSAAPNVTP
jgi:hypothetical protein